MTRIRKVALVGICAFVLGILMNKICMGSNDWMMPVTMHGCYPGMVIDSRHFCADASTNLRIFSDYITDGDGWVYSPGDILLTVGGWICIFSAGMMIGSWILNLMVKPFKKP